MINTSLSLQQIHNVTSFQDLVTTPFQGEINAICWKRKLQGDFSEIVNKVDFTETMVILEEEELRELQLSEEGHEAREILLNDLRLLREYGASPILNLIRSYERDDVYPFFPTDVYSFHVDRSPVPFDTFLCTYYGEPSDILPNSEADQKVLIPEIRNDLKKLYGGSDEGFETFLSEQFFDLHYQPKRDGQPINLGVRNMWRLAIDHPESQVLPCIHRAPREKEGEIRLLLIS